jgi:dinuclear metal center YbgI/SA1388 family protein
VTATLDAIASHLDALLEIGRIPDYPNALNGVQCSHRGPVRAVASAVDVSELSIRRAAESGANLLLVHHGLFWSGLQPLTSFRHARVRLLFDHDMAVYSAHLPLDAHPRIGNSRLLADALDLQVSGGFAHHEGVACGVQGASSIATADLLRKVEAFSRSHGGAAVSSSAGAERMTRRWAICSGAGAGVSTLAEATADGIDTLIVGEGPHWTAVDAPERGLVIIYAGHYATETLGVRALGSEVAQAFGIPHHVIDAPTGL